MNNILVKGIQNFLGKEIPVITGGFSDGQKVVLAKTIAEVHEMKMDKINELINNHLDEFEDGVDLLNLKGNETFETLAKGNGIYTQNALNKAKYIYLLSEQGYMLLVGFMKTEKAKEIRKQLRREYFAIIDNARNTIKTLENTTFQGDIDGLIISKDGIPITTSRVISEVTGKEHKNILRDIREEIDKLNQIHSSNLSSDISLIINNFKETTYLAENGQVYTQYELGEMATMQLMLKYSTEYRAKFIIAFQKMKTAMLNMFKAKVLDDVLPQNNKLRQYIYVIKNPLNETVKIGVAQDVDKRIKQLQTGAGIELELIYKSIICSNAFAIERDVHEYFKEYRTFGEWFKVNPDVVIDFLEKQDFILKSEYMKYISINNGIIKK